MDETNSVYEGKLDDAKQSLIECQTSKAVESCLSCPQLIGCPIRTQYVRAVYESMSKGEIGGFDF
ncbi:MAG: hypothetical protein Q8R58_03335 [Sulfuricurvum sp.]|jgi:hypothetical protein|nr:hypothetical protein [Sulfuricurvum sp.]